MTIPEYEQSYQPHDWTVYRLPRDDTYQRPRLAADPQLVDCHSDSPRAGELGNSPRRFYLDYELLAADLDPYLSSAVKRLAAGWSAPDGTFYPVGTLVIEAIARDLTGLILCETPSLPAA